MKKIYQKPQMEAHQLGLESIVCTSPTLLGTSANQAAGMDAKRRNVAADYEDADDGDSWSLPF